MKHLPVILFTSLVGADFVPRAIVPDASFCLPTANLTELSGCVAMTDYQSHCRDLSTSDEKVGCYCQQEMLTDYYNCQSDVTLCLGSPMLDYMFSSLTNEWHTECSARLSSLTFTPSSVPVATLMTTYDMEACPRLAMSCTSADYETNLCASTYLPAQTTEYLSCVCKEPIYSLFSECQYNGNISCKATSATESNIMGYSVCPYFRPGASTLPPIDLTSLIHVTGFESQSSGVTSRSGIASDSPTITKPPLPGTTSAVSGGPTSTKSSGASRFKFVGYGSLLRCSFAAVLVWNLSRDWFAC